METYFTLSAAHSVFTQWAVRLWDIPPSTPVSGQLHLGKHLKLSHTCGCPVQLSEGVFMWSGLYRSGNETAPSLGSLQREQPPNRRANRLPHPGNNNGNNNNNNKKTWLKEVRSSADAAKLYPRMTVLEEMLVCAHLLQTDIPTAIKCDPLMVNKCSSDKNETQTCILHKIKERHTPT